MGSRSLRQIACSSAWFGYVKKAFLMLRQFFKRVDQGKFHFLIAQMCISCHAS